MRLESATTVSCQSPNELYKVYTAMEENPVNYSQRWHILTRQLYSAQNISSKDRNLGVKEIWLSSFQNRHGTQELPNLTLRAINSLI